MANIFTSPEEVLAAERAQQGNMDLAIATGQVNPMALAGAQFGRALGQGIGGLFGVPQVESPELRQAKQRTEWIKGININSPEDLSSAARTAISQGDTSFGVQLADRAIQLQKKQPEIKQFEPGKPLFVGNQFVGFAPVAETPLDKEKVFNLEDKLRAQYQGLSKDYVKAAEGYNTIRGAAKKPDAVGDLALIFAFMKTLDPISVVREGEFAAKLDWFKRAWIKAKSGERLLPEQRKMFIDRATSLMEEHNARQNTISSEYKTLAAQYKLDPEKVTKGIPMVALLEKGKKKLSEDILAVAKKAKNPKTGKIIYQVDGKWVDEFGQEVR